MEIPTTLCNRITEAFFTKLKIEPKLLFRSISQMYGDIWEMDDFQMKINSFNIHEIFILWYKVEVQYLSFNLSIIMKNYVAHVTSIFLNTHLKSVMKVVYDFDSRSRSIKRTSSVMGSFLIKERGLLRKWVPINTLTGKNHSWKSSDLGGQLTSSKRKIARRGDIFSTTSIDALTVCVVRPINMLMFFEFLSRRRIQYVNVPIRVHCYSNIFLFKEIRSDYTKRCTCLSNLHV